MRAQSRRAAYAQTCPAALGPLADCRLSGSEPTIAAVQPGNLNGGLRANLRRTARSPDVSGATIHVAATGYRIMLGRMTFITLNRASAFPLN
jgi:hypothetical protein